MKILDELTDLRGPVEIAHGNRIDSKSSLPTVSAAYLEPLGQTMLAPGLGLTSSSISEVVASRYSSIEMWN